MFVVKPELADAQDSNDHLFQLLDLDIHLCLHSGDLIVDAALGLGLGYLPAQLIASGIVGERPGLE